MSNISSFPDIIRAVSDIWGLLALAVLMIGLLALQMTRGAHPNVRVLTFLVILGFFGGFLFLALKNGAVKDREPGAQPSAVAAASATPDVGAQSSEAAQYQKSVGGAYSSAANAMDDVARQIGEADSSGGKK